MRRTLTLIAFVAAILGLAAPAAQADYDFREYHFYAGQAICVEDHSGRTEATKLAIRRWNSRGARLMLRAECGTQANHRYIIEIAKPYYERVNFVGDYTTMEAYEGTGRAARGRVGLNRYAPVPSRAACVRQWAITHELGHAFGLQHTTRHSVMNDYDWRYCGKLTARDVLPRR